MPPVESTAPAKPAPIAAPASVAKPAAPVARAASNGDDPKVRELYERFRASRKQTGEADVSFDAIARQVRDTLPRLAEKFPGADVSLDVIVKDGRTILRPVVRKK